MRPAAATGEDAPEGAAGRERPAGEKPAARLLGPAPDVPATPTKANRRADGGSGGGLGRNEQVVSRLRRRSTSVPALATTPVAAKRADRPSGLQSLREDVEPKFTEEMPAAGWNGPSDVVRSRSMPCPATGADTLDARLTPVKAARAGARSKDVPAAGARSEQTCSSSVLPPLGLSRSARPEGVVEMHKYAKEMAIPIDSMRIAGGLFKEHAMAPRNGNVFTDGYLAKSSFRSLVKQMLGETGVQHDPMDEAIIIDRVLGSFISAEKDCNKEGVANFRDFAIWYSSHCFDEDFLDAKEQAMRKLARKLDVSTSEIDVYKRHFDHVDADGSGSIDANEFLEMLYEYSKVPKHIGLPHGYVSQLWRAADADGDGSIDFEDFIVFSKKYL
jgi:hypothetical protein